MYALFHNDRQISKAHKYRACVWIEAFERKLVIMVAHDFDGQDRVILPQGYRIKELGIE